MPERHFLLIRDRHGFERSVPINRTVTLGRQSHCDIVLSDSMVSRTHLKIESVGPDWFAEDLSSSHGTFLQYERLTRSKWEPGATLRIADGAYFLTLKRESSTTSEVHLQAILQTAQLLAEDVDLDEVLEQSLERLLAISNTDRGFIMLLEGGELIPKVQRNLGKELVRDIQLSMSTVHAVFEKGDPIWIHNVGADEKLSSHQSILDLQLKTILCLPLVIQGRRTGVVYLDSRRIITEPVDRATFEAIVSLCAIAIERTRLSEDNLRNQVLATVGQVASSIVHDFKNALFVVRGHAELLEVVSPDPKIHHHSQAILEAVERLSALSMDVLDYAKVREPLRRALEIGPFLTGIVEPLKQRAKELGVSLDTEGTPCTANLDPNRFARVVENLLANALDATAETRGSVVLGWERVTGGVQVRVKDTGKGIPKKVMRRIFEPFYSYGKRKGTGLGMATVKKIVEEHGGSLEVLSEEGQGTTVIMTIPDHGPSAQSSGSSKITGSFDSLKGSGEHRRPGSGEHQGPLSGEFKRPDAP